LSGAKLAKQMLFSMLQRRMLTKTAEAFDMGKKCNLIVSVVFKLFTFPIELLHPGTLSC
jgi:hypothetical protein